MARRNSRIISSPRYRQALDNLIAYWQGSTTRPSRVGTRGAQDTKVPAYVVPFGFDIATDAIMQTRVVSAHFDRIGAQINAAGSGAEVTLTTAKTPTIRTGFQPARVTLKLNATRSVQVVTADITRTQYLKYNGDRYSVPFGRKTATDDLNDSFQTIKANIITANSTAYLKQVSLTPERLAY